MYNQYFTLFLFPHKNCCNYGADGMKDTGVYDCLIIPGAEKKTIATPANYLAKGWCQGGGGQGLVTATGQAGKTVCSK